MEDISVIYVHLDFFKYDFSKKLVGCPYVYQGLPKYAQVSIDQSKKYFDKVKLLDSSYYRKEVEDLYKVCEIKYPNFCKDPFWFFTLARLYVLFKYVEDNSVNKFIHMEYDNLLYSDGACLNDLNEGVYFTKVGPSIGSAGFMYANSLEHSKRFLNSLQSLIEKGQTFLANEIKTSHLYEMEMIDYLKQKGFCDYLPIFPEDDYYRECSYVFDGASYGQYLAGTNNGHAEGWYGTHHFVGQKLSKGLIKVFFDNSPYLIQDGDRVNIFNLHLHNKTRINEFI